MQTLYCDTLASPLGQVVVGMSERGLARCGFLRGADAETLKWGGQTFRPIQAWGQCDRALTQLQEYFAGTRRRFDLPLDLYGTDFQQDVWQAMLAIPYGETRTYGELAAQLGRPRSTRPVGQACGQNPVGIVVPCHRVVGSSGAMTGYSGGGVRCKAALLDLERRVAGLSALKLPGL